MKLYLWSADNPEVWFDPEANLGFTESSPRHAAMMAEISAGIARTSATGVGYDKQRADLYKAHGLTADGWLEAIVETIGNMPVEQQSDKFKRLWAVRTKIRSQIPRA
jgi:hypothetical protein